MEQCDFCFRIGAAHVGTRTTRSMVDLNMHEDNHMIHSGFPMEFQAFLIAGSKPLVLAFLLPHRSW